MADTGVGNEALQVGLPKGNRGHYLQLTEDPETVNRVYRLYDAVTAEDIMRAATVYFADTKRTVVTLTQEAE